MKRGCFCYSWSLPSILITNVRIKLVYYIYIAIIIAIGRLSLTEPSHLGLQGNFLLNFLKSLHQNYASSLSLKSDALLIWLTYLLLYRLSRMQLEFILITRKRNLLCPAGGASWHQIDNDFKWAGNSRGKSIFHLHRVTITALIKN